MTAYRLIGKGTFSKVYRKALNKEVLVISNDNVKECMSLGWFPDSQLFPRIKHVGDNTDFSKSYTMKYYDKVTAPKSQLNARGYELYKALRGLSVQCINKYDLYEKWIKEVKRLPSKFAREKRHIVAAIEALTNYGADISFEISPRNIAFTPSGRLILLDCFFFRSALQEARSR